MNRKLKKISPFLIVMAVILVGIVMIIRNKETIPSDGDEKIEANHKNDKENDSQEKNDAQDNTSNTADNTGNNTTDDTKNDTQENDTKKEFLFELENGLVVTKIASYSGAYMEDGSDDKVDNVLMVWVKNNGDADLQYAQLILSDGSEQATFSLTTLPVGETMMVLETERKSYDSSVEYTDAYVENVVFFEEKLNIYSDVLRVQTLDGGFNIINISKQDITGEIVVYFKDCEDDLLCGGITYRGRIEAGLKAGEIRQVMSNNFTQNGTKVMFITIAE